MATLRSTLEQVKEQFREFLSPSMILQVCHEHDYRFRQRVLGSGVTDAGYCQARQRLPLAIDQAVVRRLPQKLGVEVQTDRWQGRRVCLARWIDVFHAGYAGGAGAL